MPPFIQQKVIEMKAMGNRVTDNIQQDANAGCGKKTAGIEMHSRSDELSKVCLDAELTALPIEILLELSNQTYFYAVIRGTGHTKLLQSVGGRR
jgi:hypothetical protein